MFLTNINLEKMKSYSLNDLDDVSGEQYILPFSADVKDEDIIDKIVSLFSNVKFYERELYSDRKKPVVSVDNYEEITIHCLYQGKEEYYKFLLHFEVFRIKYEDFTRVYYKTYQAVQDGQWMTAMTIETDHGPLLEELIEIKSLPNFLQNTKLEKYTIKL